MKKIMLALVLAGALCGCGTDNKREADTQREEIGAESTVKDESLASKNGLPTIYDFSATWCGPCREFAPIFEQAKQDYAGKINFISVDIDEQQEMAYKYQVSAVPTIMFVTATGEIKGQTQGFMNRDQFYNLIGQVFQDEE